MVWWKDGDEREGNMKDEETGKGKQKQKAGRGRGGRRSRQISVVNEELLKLQVKSTIKGLASKN